jgi:predicted nucleic-acid-binding protein
MVVKGDSRSHPAYYTSKKVMEGIMESAITAMIALKGGQGSFADALIAGLGARTGCTRTLTFDQRASRLASFELVS